MKSNAPSFSKSSKHKKPAAKPSAPKTTSADKPKPKNNRNRNEFGQLSTDPRFKKLNAPVEEDDGKTKLFPSKKPVADARFQTHIEQHKKDLNKYLEEDEDDEEVEDDDYESSDDVEPFQGVVEEIEEIDATTRLALTDFEWEYSRAVDLHVLFSSFVPQGGKVVNVSIYLSDLGFAAQDKVPDLWKEGYVPPPTKTTKHQKNEVEQSEEDEAEGDDDDDDENGEYVDEGDEEEEEEEAPERADDMDPAKIEEFEAQRRKHYYAVITFDCVDTAHHCYVECQGREIELAGVVLNLSYVPVDMSFDPSRLHDQSSRIPHDYQRPPALELMGTNPQALKKGGVSWDLTDVKRTAAVRKAFSAVQDMEMDDLDAYVASEASDDGIAGNEQERRQLLRKKYLCLLDGYDPEKEEKKSGKQGGKADDEDDENEDDDDDDLDIDGSDVSSEEIDAIFDPTNLDENDENYGNFTTEIVVPDEGDVQGLHNNIVRGVKKSEAQDLATLRDIRKRQLRKEEAKRKKRERAEEQEEEDSDKEGTNEKLASTLKQSLPEDDDAPAFSKRHKRKQHKQRKQLAAKQERESRQMKRYQAEGLTIDRTVPFPSDKNVATPKTLADDRFLDRLKTDTDFHVDTSNPAFKKRKK